MRSSPTVLVVDDSPTTCLILDVMLPDISGYAVCRQVQQSRLEHQIYVILISEKNAPLDQSYGLRQGANRYLPKPFTAEDLVQAVWKGVPGHLRQTVLPSTLSTLIKIWSVRSRPTILSGQKIFFDGLY